MDETYLGLTLDRFQREAMDAIARDEDVIVAAPTGAGKTLIAHYAIERALAQGKRAVYTAPIKALSNQKYRDLSEAFPGRVGISTGDVSIDPGAQIVIMTTEIFRNTIFEDPARCAETGWVIFDEVHYLDDPERGTVWEEALIFAPKGIRVLALSATVSNLKSFATWVEQVRAAPLTTVLETHRPVPLEVRVASSEGPIRSLREARELRLSRRDQQRGRERRRGQEIRRYYERAQRRLVEEVAAREELPLLFFLFSRKACERLAQACVELDLLPGPDGRAAQAALRELAVRYELDLQDPEVATLDALVRRGIAYHHAGLLPALKEIVERLFAAGHLRLLAATETFALGINMPARAVAFEGIQRWNGVARVPLKAREFQQMAGRAGRRGIDARGTVYMSFDAYRDEPSLFQAVATGPVEPVRSQFDLSYGTLINLYERLGDDIYEACERSFAHFTMQQREKQGGRRGRRARAELAGAVRERARRDRQGREPHGREPRGRGRGRRGRRQGRREGRPPRANAGYDNVVRQVRARLGILMELDYLDSRGRVRPRGRFAKLVFGHELELSELVWSGVFDRLSPEQIAVLAAAVVFESRSGVFYGGGDAFKLLGRQPYKLASKTVGRLVALEQERGIRQTCKLLDWNLSGVVWAWVQGASFDELRGLSDGSDGDLVRALRQTIQLLRLARRPLRALHRGDLLERVRAAQGLLKRGLVDAEWQLRRAGELGEDEDGDRGDAEHEGAPEEDSDEAFAAGLI